MASSSFQTSPILSSTATTTVEEGGATSIAAIHSDILQTHILTRLDGPALASAACSSTQLYRLAGEECLWANICNSTWPSTNTPRLRHLISTFPKGPRSFFSSSFPIVANSELPNTGYSPPNHNRPSELISAVDVYYRGELIFCKVVETETVSGWFRCSPFRVDMLDPKDVVSAPITYQNGEDTCAELADDITLSWILIDPNGRRAVNLSSHKAVSVQRHWLSGEVQLRFASILGGERGTASECVQCGIVVTCGESEGGELQVREVSLQMEDMDGSHLNGKKSLVIMQKTLEGKMVRKGRREGGGKKKYQEYLEKKRERKERKIRTEGTLDMMCVAFGVCGLISLILFNLF